MLVLLSPLIVACTSAPAALQTGSDAERSEEARGVLRRQPQDAPPLAEVVERRLSCVAFLESGACSLHAAGRFGVPPAIAHRTLRRGVARGGARLDAFSRPASRESRSLKGTEFTQTMRVETRRRGQ